MQNISQALNIAYTLREKLVITKNILSSAKNWGIYDLWSGGFFTSLVKREKMDNAYKDLKEVEKLCNELSSYLNGITLTLNPNMLNADKNRGWDIWFDNLFTDFKVQRDIKNTLEKVCDLQDEVEDIIDILTENLKKQS
ncbi:hypothetical protein KG091_05375 [Carnobacteriaceae bacterium zg-ZUI78]|nr:hypothetical protein [Carnobacteriaceae bacterium zg-ZUI78]